MGADAIGDGDTQMAIEDETDGSVAGAGAHTEMMALFEQFRADRKNLTQQMKTVIDNRVTKLFLKLA